MLIGPTTSPPNCPSTLPALSDSDLMTFRPAFKAHFSRRVSVDGGDGGGDGVMAAVDVRVAAGSGGVGTVMGKGRGAGIDTG